MGKGGFMYLIAWFVFGFILCVISDKFLIEIESDKGWFYILGTALGPLLLITILYGGIKGDWDKR